MDVDRLKCVPGKFFRAMPRDPICRLHTHVIGQLSLSTSRGMPHFPSV